jgi:hypothetical protein
MGNEAFRENASNNKGTKYVVTHKNMMELQQKIIHTMEQIAMGTGMVEEGKDTLDEILCQRVAMMPNVEEAVDEIQTALEYSCQSLLTQNRPTGKALRHKSVPWWTAQLTIQRREVNLKRRYQRTKGNNALREIRKEQYLASKAEYAAAIRQEKK